MFINNNIYFQLQTSANLDLRSSIYKDKREPVVLVGLLHVIAVNPGPEEVYEVGVGPGIYIIHSNFH